MANFRNQMASQHSFAMIPRSDIPRSRYMLQKAYKTTMNASYLYPIYCEEMVPGDHFEGSAELFGRFATPIAPVLDNAELETFFFFVPNRLSWEHWEDFISGVGSYILPVIQSPAGGFTAGSIYDYFGIPINNQSVGSNVIEVNALPLRAYNRIFNEWFRDQNLYNELTMETGDGPEAAANYHLVRRMKKHDYFTSALPWPQKGTAVELPLGTTAPVVPDISDVGLGSNVPYFKANTAVWPGPVPRSSLAVENGSDTPVWGAGAVGSTGTNGVRWDASGLVTDLSSATAATINALRQAFQIQRMLEKDARGGSRYIEQIHVHFGVRPPDYRLQRPEYIGGGRSMVNTHPIAQTSETSDTPQGNLAAFTTVHGQGHRFRYAATEHGYIIGLAMVRADITYQNGLRRHWSRQTRYDFYFPTLAHLGEQSVKNKEIFLAADASDEDTFGYQERWAEYRYTPNEITGQFRSSFPTPLDMWHYSQNFDDTPFLNANFMEDASFETLARTLAVGTEANGQQVLLDALFRVRATRPMPTYSVPGLIDHF